MVDNQIVEELTPIYNVHVQFLISITSFHHNLQQKHSESNTDTVLLMC